LYGALSERPHEHVACILSRALKNGGWRMKAAEKKLYLVVLKDKTGRPGINYALHSKLKDEQATIAPHGAKPDEKNKSKPEKNDDDSAKSSVFLDLMQDTGREMEVFRSLEFVLAFLLTASPSIQFMSTVVPTLKKIAREEQGSDDRTIYSFDPRNAGEVVRALRRATNGIRAASQFPHLALIGLVSAYDVMLQKLLLLIFRNEEKTGSSISRSLKLKDLRSFSSIDKAVNYFIESEIESILRKDHLEQIKELNNLFGYEVDSDHRCVQEFMEICERRNIFTHNKGIVNRHYLTKCKGYKVDTGNLKIGSVLTCGQVYFKQAVTVTDELSIRLIQYVWRKVVPKERDLAESELNQSAYRLIVGEEYSLAERILEYGINHTGKGKEENRRMMAVNYANAIKLGGDKKRALQELDKMDWSATT
jgi:hypothetical protein